MKGSDLESEKNNDFIIKLKLFAVTFNNIVKELNQRQKKMLITMHRFLDGDAFGSAVALGLLFRKLNIDSTLLCIPFVPEKFRFLGFMSKLHIVMPPHSGKRNVREFFFGPIGDYFSGIINDYGALTILDCAGIDQIPKEAWSIGKRLPYKINIDHHIGYKLSSAEGRVLNLVGDLSSTSEILYRLMQEIGVDVFPEIAVPLYIGIISDLRKNDISKDSANYPKAALKELGVQIKQAGVETQRQIRQVFSLDSWETYLLKLILSEVRFVDTIVYVEFNPDMVYQAKAATDSLNNPKMPFHEFHIRLRQELRRLKNNFQIVVIFDRILDKVSLYDLQKNSTYDLAYICRELGNGGGHVNRAGFSLDAARRKLFGSNVEAGDLSDDVVMEKIVGVVKERMNQ